MQTAPTTSTTSGSVHPAHALPDELWALVLSKITWKDAWREAKPLLLWRPGAARALQASAPLLAHLLSSRHGHSALRRAAARNSVDVAALLLQQCETSGAAVQGALKEAAFTGHIAMLQLLLNHGTCELSDALLLAAGNGQSKAAELLLDQGLDERARREAFSTAANAGHMDIMRMLVQRGINMISALNASAWVGNTSAVALLLDAGVNLAGGAGHCLLFAAGKGHSEVVQLLLERGVVGDILMRVAVEYAAQQGHKGCVEVLLRHGAALPADQLQVMVRSSAAAGHADLVELLFFHGRARTRGAERQLAALLTHNNQ